ncbi:hypothetical protein SLE2022_040550 [Rubroshorea leprosula]
MGICASSQFRARDGSLNWLTSTAKIIHSDGSLLEFPHTIKVSSILSLNPNCFLCNSEQMHVDSLLPHVAGDDELQQGQIYFLMPLSKSQVPISFQDMCSLAVKASTALTRLEMEFSSKASPQFPEITRRA